MSVVKAMKAAELPINREKVPSGGCMVAATALHSRAKFLLTEDPHFAKLNEIETRRTTKVRM